MSMVSSTESGRPSVSGKIALFAGEGELPVSAARNMLAKGLDVFVYAMDKGNIKAFRSFLPASRVHFIHPGLLEKNFVLMKGHGMGQGVFVGKVNKWALLRNPRLDARAWEMWRSLQSAQRNDDSVMLTIIAEFEKNGIKILPQTDYLQDMFSPVGLYSRRKPTESEVQDIEMGLDLAREMGRLDVGQTVVISNLMAIAIEAIEGTDQAILRSKRWVGKKGGVVVKVEKPGQDQRFDVPAVGTRTLKNVKKAGLNVLAVEAGKTLMLDLPQMTALADKLDISLVAV